MPTVYCGNHEPIDHHTGSRIEGPLVTTAHIDDGWPLDHMVAALTSRGEGAWARHSDADQPAWVDSDNAELAAALARVWGCPIGRPTDDQDSTPEPSGQGVSP